MVLALAGRRCSRSRPGGRAMRSHRRWRRVVATPCPARSAERPAWRPHPGREAGPACNWACSPGASSCGRMARCPPAGAAVRHRSPRAACGNGRCALGPARVAPAGWRWRFQWRAGIPRRPGQRLSRECRRQEPRHQRNPAGRGCLCGHAIRPARRRSAAVRRRMMRMAGLVQRPRLWLHRLAVRAVGIRPRSQASVGVGRR